MSLKGSAKRFKHLSDDELFMVSRSDVVGEAEGSGGRLQPCRIHRPLLFRPFVEISRILPTFKTSNVPLPRILFFETHVLFAMQPIKSIPRIQNEFRHHHGDFRYATRDYYIPYYAYDKM